MKKRILFAALVFVLVLSLSVFASAEEITSVDRIFELMNTTDATLLAGDYTLGDSLDLSKYTGTYKQSPIGDVDHPFTGTFDGGGHTIEGIDIRGEQRVGLFGFAADATIKNLTIYGTVTGTGNAVGGFVGHVDTASVTIENCVNYCAVSGVDSVGGIIGRVETASSTVYISECVNYGTISAARYAAGIAGFHSQTGGATTIENCINNGTISASTSYAAGISAYWRIYSGAKNKCFVQDCMNTGSVTTGGSGYAGGIIAYGSNRNYAYTITRCFNSGSITGSKYTRPIAGTVSEATHTAGKFSNCYYTSTDTYTADSYGVEIFVADATVAASVAGLGDAWVLVDGHAPELKALHDHDYKYASVGAEHKYACYCGDVKVTEAHNFVNGVCDKCGAEDVPCAHENKYEVVEKEATCTSVGSKYEFCPECQTKVSEDIEIPTDADNHSGALIMALANGAVTYTCADCSAVVYTDTALLDTVYVSENGKELIGSVTEQIGTAADPFKNFTDAMQYAAYCGKDVTINIIDSATVPANYKTPAFDDTITVTGGELITNNRLVMNGKFVFEHLTINPLDTLVMAAKEHKLVMGEGLTMTGKSIYLVGGYENVLCSNSEIPATGFASDITLRSGTYGAVGGGNRYLSGKYSGTIQITLGKTNKNDTLAITSTLTTASMNYEGGDGVYATIIIDGTVDEINSFCPVSHATTANGRFDIDLVVMGAATTDASKLYWRGSNYTFNAYADSRVDGAEEFAAVVVGAENVQPYKRYCLKVNKNVHPDANGDAFCDNCGSSTACEHESGEWRETADATCASPETYTWYCLDCKELIEDMTKNGDAVDTTNHISENFVWQFADGKYFFACTACGINVEQTDAPTIYVSESGNNALDGTAKEKAVATVEEAVGRLANVGGTVEICGTYTLSENLTLPTHAKEITIRGNDNAGEYGSFVISKTTVLTLGGSTKFDKIGFGGSAIYVFECMWNDTTFGTVQPYGTATAYVVLGDYDITENDTEPAAATLTITEGTSQRHTESGTRYVDRFYERIYLGDTFGADGVSVGNKTVTFNATDADIEILYTMSTSGKYKNNPVTDCEATVNLYGLTKVDKGRTGDYNVAYAESTASLDKQTINFFDNSYIGTNYYIRNAKDTTINVSAAADGRYIPIRCPFTFYAYGTFANENTPMNIKVNYSTHSFSSVVETPCTYANEAEALKVYSETKVKECDYTSKVTNVATPTEKGTLLYSCTCGRCYIEEYEYCCTEATHVYTAYADGTFKCSVCKETFTTVSENIVVKATPAAVADGKVSVNVNVAGTFAAALVNITAPEGFVFADATLPENTELVLVGNEASGVYSLTVMSANGADKEIVETITLSYSVDETAIYGGCILDVSASEAYNANGEAVIMTPVSAEIVYAKETVTGDLNGDGIVTIADALTLIRVILNNQTIANGDVNGDGKIGLADVIRVMKLIIR